MLMADFSILTDEFMNTVAKACSKARTDALDAGHPIVYIDEAGRYVEEHPSGRRFEIRFDQTQPRELHVVVVRELQTNTA